MNDQFTKNFTEMCIGLLSFISSPDDGMEHMAKCISIIHAEGQL